MSSTVSLVTIRLLQYQKGLIVKYYLWGGAVIIKLLWGTELYTMEQATLPGSKKQFCYIYESPMDEYPKKRDVPYFQISFLPGDLYSPYNIALSYDIPYLGYYGETYYFRDELALIRFRPISIFNVIPVPLRRILAIHLKVRARNLDKVLSGKEFTFMALASGLLWKQQFTPQPIARAQPVNLVYHLWNARKYARENVVPHFNEQTAFGIFKADGVQQAANYSIAFNELTPQQVYWHNAFSPNNVCFSVTPERAFSTFWVLAVSQDKQRIHCCLYLLANTAAAEELLINILESSGTIHDVFSIVEALNQPCSGIQLAPQDYAALFYWSKVLVASLHEGPMPDKLSADRLDVVSNTMKGL